MKKRILALLLAMTLIFAQALMVSAAPSRQPEDTKENECIGKEDVTDPDRIDDIKDQFPDKDIDRVVDVECDEDHDWGHREGFYVPIEDGEELEVWFYDEETGEWIQLEYEIIDGLVWVEWEGNGTIVFMVDGKVITPGGDSPKTGTEPTWMLWMAAACTLGAAAVVLKKEN